MPSPSPQADRPVYPPPAGPTQHEYGTAAAESVSPGGVALPAAAPKPLGLMDWQAGWRGLVALGLLVPWYFNLRYFADGGSVLPQVFFRDAMANALTTAITLDVYLAAVAFSAWVLGERRVRWPWLVVVACFGVGLSFALPLYLLLRRRRVG